MPSTKHGYNERSLAIDLISDINLWLANKDIAVKRAGGEHSLHAETGMLFPDILLFGDRQSGSILQGWELKFPDTPIDDTGLVENAGKKARHLGLNSFVVWNVTCAVLYQVTGATNTPLKTWNRLSHIRRRDEVHENYELITEQLYEILTDMNSLFDTGVIKPTSFVHAITGDDMTDLLLEDVELYANAMKAYATRNASFEDDVTLWWLASKQDFHGDTDRWKVLARTNTIALFNKLVFAHVLRHYNSAANLVDQITDDSSVAAGLALFEEISRSADFWNIFNKSLGEEQLPPATWQKIIQLNLALRDFHFAEIERSTTQDLLEKVLEKTKRKAAGQFATPPNLADLAVRLVIDDPAQNYADFCSGTGTIARAIYDYKLIKGVADAHESVWASDKFALPIKVTTLAMVDPGKLGNVLNVFQADATTLQTGQQIELRHPYDGQPVVKDLPTMHGIISNLPFVQQEDLATLNPDIERVNDDIRRLTGSNDFGLGARSDLYAYLPFYLWHLLDRDGRAGIIISNSWLGTAMGQAFYKSLGRFFFIESVITSVSGRWFQNADVVTNLVILRKNDDPSREITQQIAFVELKKPIDALNHDDMVAVRALIRNGQPQTTDLCTLRVYDNMALHALEARSLPLNAFFADLTWLDDITAKTIPIQQIFEVKRGERRGWDPLFYPVQQGDIEDEYIKPVLKSSRSLTGLSAAPDKIAFCCTRSINKLEELGHIGAIQWIKRFEGQRNEKGKPLPEALQRAGMHWYTMEPSTTADIVASVNPGQRLFFGRFEEPTFVDQRLMRLTLRDRTQDLDLLHALMNSTLGLFYIEALGFGRGQGVLDLNPTKLGSAMRVFDPALISADARNNIVTKFHPLQARPVQKLNNELRSQDRLEFDKAVFEAYGMGHVREAVASALLTLYDIRNTVMDSA